MSNLAFVLVLCAAVSHALWNFYAKKSPANSIALALGLVEAGNEQFQKGDFGRAVAYYR